MSRFTAIFILLTLLAVQGFNPSLCDDEDNEIGSCILTHNVTVSGDGSGDFKTISEAVASVPNNNKIRFNIFVKEGVYYENVLVPKKKDNVLIYGEGMAKTVISSNLSRLEFPKSTTASTATFSVFADNFIARDIKFVNTAGPEKFQAVAFHSKSNHSAMFRCAFFGYQDTLYAHVGEQLYRECEIVGTVDFIFGNAAAVFDMCSIRARKPLMQQVVTVTAQGADNQEKSGFSIIRSKILRFEDEEFTAVAYLGRPWNSHATVVIMETELGSLIDPKGWVAWNSSADPPPPTVNLGEFRNYGPGSDVRNRVTWVGYNPVMAEEDAQRFTIDGFINKLGWLNVSCVPYNGSL
ncbi:PREDICTED: pectinesterase 1-like [Brassica oleracea var. oleracea]|uniref:Pectinesterase n=2 Tax=Brassica oleracea TaxID=3712 RepID=A0A0D3ADG8_BRAOL|nr:PREDICTED: pectinesterase 1-like [Brassica oleracea var. oleracea]